ncbi:hypothetical protein, partial [Clostridium sp. 3-3]|uniref:hypothetical protein n=1 Tax=Clostridium sp. 3-3 TaxID=2070757 RepID=UPI001FA9408F
MKNYTYQKKLEKIELHHRFIVSSRTIISLEKEKYNPSIKLAILLPFLLLFSLTEIRRSLSKSMSKEDIIKNNDERDKYILLKTSYKSLEILRSINFIVIMLSMILFAVTKSEFVLGIFVVSSIYMTLNFLVELAV